jgi:response regulator NasT
LIVDDDRLILATLSKGLEQGGYEIFQATSGEEALRIVSEQDIELAILDIRMPNMSGIELAKHLRDRTEIPFMFFTAYSDIDIAKQAAECGAVGYLVKPTDTPQIIPAIEAGLARSAEIRDLRQTESALTAALAAGRETSMAIGVLMERYHMNRNTAFETLRIYARTHRRKINEVAAELINAEETLNLLPITDASKVRPAPV